MKLASKIICVAIFAAILAGCVGTVTPVQVVSNGASFDNGERNSGFIGWATNNGTAYGVITLKARDRYNALIESYGSKIIPPIKKDYGLISCETNYLISFEALSNFAKMNRWRKNGQ